MFEPDFRNTDPIVNRLVEITSARDTVINAHLVPRWEVTLLRDALPRAAPTPPSTWRCGPARDGRPPSSAGGGGWPAAGPWPSGAVGRDR